MKRLILVACFIYMPTVVLSQSSEFVGEWLLQLENDNRIGMPAVGSLVLRNMKIVLQFILMVGL